MATISLPVSRLLLFAPGLFQQVRAFFCLINSTIFKSNPEQLSVLAAAIDPGSGGVIHPPSMIRRPAVGETMVATSRGLTESAARLAGSYVAQSFHLNFFVTSFPVATSNTCKISIMSADAFPSVAHGSLIFASSGILIFASSGRSA